MTISQAIVLGLIQGLTEFIPVSSTAHLWLAQSFMHLDVDGTALPIILGAGAKTLMDMRHATHALPTSPVLMTGFLTAAVSGAVVIRLLLAYLATHTLRPFAVYLLILGSLLIALSLTGVLRH